MPAASRKKEWPSLHWTFDRNHAYQITPRLSDGKNNGIYVYDTPNIVSFAEFGQFSFHNEYPHKGISAKKRGIPRTERADVSREGENFPAIKREDCWDS